MTVGGRRRMHTTRLPSGKAKIQMGRHSSWRPRRGVESPRISEELTAIVLKSLPVYDTTRGQKSFAYLFILIIALMISGVVLAWRNLAFRPRRPRRRQTAGGLCRRHRYRGSVVVLPFPA